MDEPTLGELQPWDFAEKSTWGPGPWQDEPDRLEWRHAGLACLIVRNQQGALCGYAAVPPGHPWHGAHFRDIDVYVHGGLNYSKACDGEICHVPAPGEPADVWWLGFDCGHGFDFAPAINALLRAVLGEERSQEFPLYKEKYREIWYVRANVEALAQQVVQAAAR
jgi:hypothetical protein